MKHSHLLFALTVWTATSAPLLAAASPVVELMEFAAAANAAPGSDEPVVGDVTALEEHDSVRGEIAPELASPLPPLEAASSDFEFDSIFAELDKMSGERINFRYFLNPAGEFTEDVDRHLRIEPSE